MRNKIKIATLSLILTIIIGLIDYLVIYQISLSLFYLFPILIGTYYIDNNFGIFLALVSVSIWGFSDAIANQESFLFLIYWWNFIVRLGVFLILIYFLSRLKKAYESEKIYARTDQLTGVSNRRYFLELLNHEFKRSQRYKSIIYVIVYKTKF